MGDKVIQKQLETLLFDFDQADKDKNGSLCFQEVYDVLKAQGFKGTEEEAQSIFKDFDCDQNKIISRDEFTTAVKNLPKMSIREFYLRKMFNAMDRDGSGSLSRTEILDAMRRELVGMDISGDTACELVLAQCKDNDGMLNYEEFLWVFRIESECSELRKIFNALDADGSGYLTREEVYAALKSDCEVKLSDKKITDLVIHLIRDADKKISYAEFIQVWQQERKK